MGGDLQLRLGSSSVEFLKGLSDRLEYTVIRATLNPLILVSGDFRASILDDAVVEDLGLNLVQVCPVPIKFFALVSLRCSHDRVDSIG